MSSRKKSKLVADTQVTMSAEPDTRAKSVLASRTGSTATTTEAKALPTKSTEVISTVTPLDPAVARSADMSKECPLLTSLPIENPKTAREQLFMQLRPYAKLLFIFNMFAFSLMTTVIMGQILNHKLKPKSVWEMLPTPDIAEFDDFIIASTSETCNEYARQTWTESPDVKLVSLTMSMCVSLLEPHNSGMGGQSIALQLDAKSGSCLQTRGHFGLPADLKLFRRQIEREPALEHIGQFASAVPGYIRTLRGLFQMSGRPEEYKQKLLFIAKRMFAENDQFPISRSFHGGLNSNNLDLHILMRNFFSYMLGPELTVKREGERYRIPYSEYLHFGDLLSDDPKAILPESLLEYGEDDRNRSKEWLDWQGFSDRGKDVVDGLLVQIGDHTACVPSDPASASIVARAINLTTVDTSDEMGESTMMSPQFYVEMIARIEKLYELVQEADEHLTADQRENLEILSRRTIRSKPVMNYGANMYSLIDLKNQKATVMVASLGSSFGSMTPDSKNRYTLNNFLAHLGKFYPLIGSNQYMLQPLIAMKDNKITVAWAGCGGFLTQSMDVARMMTSLTLNLLKKVPLYKAVTSPLFYLMPDEGLPGAIYLQFTRGVPWFRLNWLVRRTGFFWESRDTSVGSAEERIDRAVAVEVAKDGRAQAFYFDSSNHRSLQGKQMLPNGF